MIHWSYVPAGDPSRLKAMFITFRAENEDNPTVFFVRFIGGDENHTPC